MNERIKQITGQVLDEIVPDTWTALGYDKIKDIQNRTAELIIKECIDVVGKATASPNGYQALMKHFGVE